MQTDETPHDADGAVPEAAISGEAVAMEISIEEPQQLFHRIDPSPFREKDLDPSAESFIVGWAREAHRNAALSLVVYVARPAEAPDEAAKLIDAVHEFFRARARATRAKLRLIFRYGRISLVIGFVCMAISIAIGHTLEDWLDNSHLAALLSDSVLIGGWVAMWKPLEIFLYDWWPIRAEARLFDRLSTMPIRVAYGRKPAPDR